MFALFTLNAKEFRVDSKALLEAKDSYKILDTRESKLYKEGHIINALNFPIALTFDNMEINGKITSPLKMQEIIRTLGLDVNDEIAIYDGGSFFDAARVFWALEVYGFKNVKLLTSSYLQWRKQKFPIETKINKIEKSSYIARINNKRLATKFTTQIAVKNPNVSILDARLYEAYVGEKSAAKRFGHIKTASHISARHNINYNDILSTLKDVDALEQTYKSINKNKKVVVYCDVGKVAAMNYFALRELGYDVSNYDASWKEWGNDSSLPITNLSK